MKMLTSETNRFVQILAGWCTLLMLGISTARADYSVPAKMAWWYDARFGMIIHFGSYSYYGNGEWEFFNDNWTKTNYQTQISANFNPTNFNATAIVSFAKAAGMKYIVITAKHHEGFAMWHSQVPGFTDVTGTKLYNLYDYAGFHRDLLMELKNACDAQGIKFCLYYSIMDWNHPSQTVNHSTYYSTMSSMTARTNYINDMKAQLSELITNYNPAVLWFDGDWCANLFPQTLDNWWNQSDGTNLYNYLIQLKPDLVINERVKRDLGLGDFAIAEQTVPAAALARPWETGATMNGVWGYTTWAEGNYRSASNILAELVQVVSRDGNYLLNIGPMGDGTMTPGSTNILGQLAPWMNIYGESVHGTTISPFGSAEPSWGYYTKCPGKLYAHVLTWPGTQLQVPLLTNTINRVYLLNDTNTSLSYTVSGGNINISLPVSAPNAMDSVVVIDVSGVPTAVNLTVQVPLVNPGFELPGTGKVKTGFSSIPGWANTGGSYTDTGVQPGGHSGSWEGYEQTSEGGTYQISSYQIHTGDHITLTWWAQGEWNGSSTSYPGTGPNDPLAHVSLLRATTTNDAYGITTGLATNLSGIPGGVWTQFTLTYTAGAADAGKYLGLSFVCTKNVGNTAGTWAGFDDFALTVVPSPSTPSGLTATGGDAQVTLNWSAATYTSGYNVKRSTTSGGAYSVVATNIWALSFTNTGLSNGTLYYFVVTGTNQIGESTNSVEVSARPASLTPPPINFSVVGGRLQFAWPQDHTGWRLQAQTNPPGAGLGTNWTTLSGSELTNQFTLPVDTANGSVFFLLVSP